MKSVNTTSTNGPVYEELVVLRDEDGVACKITRHRIKGHLSYDIYREYHHSKKGLTRSAFLLRRQGGAVRRILERAEAWMDAYEDRERYRKLGAIDYLDGRLP